METQIENDMRQATNVNDCVGVCVLGRACQQFPNPFRVNCIKRCRGQCLAMHGWPNRFPIPPELLPQQQQPPPAAPANNFQVPRQAPRRIFVPRRNCSKGRRCGKTCISRNKRCRTPFNNGPFICVKGKPCGRSCIKLQYDCHKG